MVFNYTHKDLLSTIIEIIFGGVIGGLFDFGDFIELHNDLEW